MTYALCQSAQDRARLCPSGDTHLWNGQTGSDRSSTAFDIGNFVIGWYGGRSASRAVFDSMPNLVAADKVTILTAPDDKRIASASVRRLLASLERHGVKPAVTKVDVKRTDVGRALQGAAAETGAGLLIMGAFGRSRLRE